MVARDTTTLPLELMEQAGCIFAGLDQSGCVTWLNAFGQRLWGLESAKRADTPLIGGLLQDAENPEVDLARLAQAILQEPDGCSPSILVALFSTKSYGVGLGLPIVRKIARQHRGEVAIESRPGEGTTAIVSIPCLEEREA